MPTYHSASGSVAEDLFIELFSEAFGAEKAGYLYSQYHFYDIYQNSRYADFVLENGARRVAIEIDDETSHNKSLVASNKFYDDLLKQNSMVHLGWDVYRNLPQTVAVCDSWPLYGKYQTTKRTCRLWQRSECRLTLRAV